MITLLAAVVRSLTPVALIAGLTLARRTDRRGEPAWRAVLFALAAGLLVGVASYVLGSRAQLFIATRVALDAAAILGALVHGASLLLRGASKAQRLLRAGCAVFFLAGLAAASTFSLLDQLGEQGVSAVQVMNTEMILNGGVLALGGCLAVFLTPLSLRLAPKSGGTLVAGCLLAASALVAVPWCAETLLGLMRLDLVPVRGDALSFVAKVRQFSVIGSYLQVALVSGLALSLLRRREAAAGSELSATPSPERRKAQAQARSGSLWLRTAAGFVVVILAVLLAQDLYASRPPRISRPLPVTPDAGGLIRVRLADVSDGGLHRYSYVTGDGHVVRFFVIELDNRSGRKRFGVVYDACVMCGDAGYIQRKREVFCLACNVRIHEPSIGKEGGCNPIPLAHALEDGEVVIGAAELERGAAHFSQVVSVKVKDPVTGAELDTLRAPVRYEHEGRTYFFESVESQRRFVAAPQRYRGAGR